MLDSEGAGKEGSFSPLPRENPPAADPTAEPPNPKLNDWLVVISGNEGWDIELGCADEVGRDKLGCTTLNVVAEVVLRMAAEVVAAVCVEVARAGGKVELAPGCRTFPGSPVGRVRPNMGGRCR